MERFAIIVGTNCYEHNKLQYTIKDARDIKQILQQRCEFKTENIIKIEINLGDKGSLVDKLHEAFKTIENKGFKKDESTFLFYYSGHGMLETENNESYLELSYQERISTQMIVNKIDELGGRNNYLIVDACHSGAPLKLFYSKSGLNRQQRASLNFTSKGFYCLLGTTADREAGEYIEVKNGYLTYYFIEAINSPANYNKNGFLGFSTIEEHTTFKCGLITKFKQIPVTQIRKEGFHAFATWTDAPKMAKTTSSSQLKEIDYQYFKKFEIKIILYPEIAKTKNADLFEKLMQGLLKSQNYVLTQNVNFTGLEIDLYGRHLIENKTLLIECKAKQKPNSLDIKNFLFNICMEKKADHGYFIHLEELDSQEVSLINEWKQKAESKNFTFLGPKQIIELLVDSGKIKHFSLTLSTEFIVEKFMLVYTYFGIYYIAFVNTGGTLATDFYVFDAVTLEEKNDLSYHPNQEYAKEVTFDKILKKEIDGLKELKHKTFVQSITSIASFEIYESFLEYLQNPGVNYLHPQTSDILLDDIFIAPDLKEVSLNKVKNNSNTKFTNLMTLSNIVIENGIKYVLLGDENSGKTSICKSLFMRYYYKGYTPVLINGSELSNNIRVEILEKAVEQAFEKQYSNCKYKSIIIDKIILIIDDFHKIKVKEGHREILMQNICSKYKNVIITGNLIMPLEIIQNKTTKFIFESFELYSIIEFGTKLRSQLIQKWNTLGQDVNLLDKNDLLRKNDSSAHHVDSIIGKNYIPAYPFYILIILQTAESINSSNANYSLHGFYYELIINDALNKAINDKNDISLFINYITHLCYLFFETKAKTLEISEFEEFHKLYCNKHDIKYSYKIILSTLSAAKLIEVNGSVSIPYKYVYYFFVAKYLTNTISNKETKETIQKMCKRLYREEFSNIIMFLTHLSKDQFIINELITNAKSIFANNPITKLEDDVIYINKLAKVLPKQVLQLIDIKDIREKELDEKAEIERIEKEIESTRMNTQEFEYDLEENTDAIDHMAQLTLALKNVEILGQVAKKYWGEMTGEQKYEISSETYFLALRTLNNYFSLIEQNSEVLVNQIAKLIDKKHLKDRFLLKNKIEDISSEFIFTLCFLSSFGIIRKLTHSIGYDKLDTTFKSILEKNAYNSVKLINLSIKLEHYSGFPIKTIEEIKEDLVNNQLGYLILRNLVINYLYMFHTDYKIKTKLCNLLGIEMKEQYLIDNISKVKK